MPTDETELDRLDMAHHMMLLTLGGEIHRAPVKDPHNVLDCGTGTGIWALVCITQILLGILLTNMKDFGAFHEESQVIGVDMTPIQPTW